MYTVLPGEEGLTGLYSLHWGECHFIRGRKKNAENNELYAKPLLLFVYPWKDDKEEAEETWGVVVDWQIC